MKEPQKKYKVSTRRKIYRIAIVTTFIYCSVGIVLYHLQEWFLFEPIRLPKDYKFKFNGPFEEINIAINKTDTLNIIKFYPADSIPRGVVLYFHGNTENVNRYARFASNFTKHGYEVLMPDYPTYGKSTGELTEDNIYRQAKEVYKLAHSKFPAPQIIVYGMSLGTGVASYLAAKEDCAQLILETPYYSIPDLFSAYAPVYPTKRMSHFKFPVNDYLKEIKEPITIFHGTSDETIPFRCAAKLKKILKPTDEFVTIENGAHNNLNDFSLFHEKLDSILK
jgi:alpha-beta hydrolase superfamily lysophospholipase